MEAELKIKDEKILMLQKEVEDQKKKIDQLSEQMGFVMSEKDRQIHVRISKFPLKLNTPLFF